MAISLSALIFISFHKRLRQFTLDAASPLSWLREWPLCVYRPEEWTALGFQGQEKKKATGFYTGTQCFV